MKFTVTCFLALFALAALPVRSGSVLAITAQEKIDVTGTWDMTVESPQGTGSPTVILKQEGENLTGTYKGRLGESKLEGTVKGKEIQFSVSLKFQDQALTITYSGTVEKDSMTGSAQFGDVGKGTWTARRK